MNESVPVASERTSTPPVSLAVSFRDPAGSLFPLDGHIFRVVNAAGVADLSAFFQDTAAKELLDTGRIVGTRYLNSAESAALLRNPEVRRLYDATSGETILEHERIEFPSFPYEWPPEMLHAAAVLTLELAEGLLSSGLGLKDATPYNVLFRGPDPVFIDVLSFERRDPGDPTWLPYAQFVRTFLLPLLANRHLGMALDQLLTTRREGLEPEEVYRWLSRLDRIRPDFLSLVSMPAWLGKRHSPDDQKIYRKKSLDDPEKAQFILRSILKGLRRKLNRLEPKPGKNSVWANYMESNSHYSEAQFAAKERFVSEALTEFRPRRVLDAGCNTGHFSRMAAKAGASVVAIDYDPVVVGEVWKRARAEKLDILPLNISLTRPSPGTGWRNRECSPFLDRARGRFDAVLMLALIHHLLVTERIPLPDILALAAELTSDFAVIEFIAPDDPMFQRLTRGREDLHKELTYRQFENLCQEHFEILRVQHVENSTRWLYLLRRRL